MRRRIPLPAALAYCGGTLTAPLLPMEDQDLKITVPLLDPMAMHPATSRTLRALLANIARLLPDSGVNVLESCADLTLSDADVLDLRRLLDDALALLEEVSGEVRRRSEAISHRQG